MNEFITNQLISSEFVTGEFTIVVRLAQLDRAFGYGPKGRGFESSSVQYKKPRKLNGLRGFLLFKNKLNSEINQELTKK